MARRATSLNAMFSAVKLGALATTTAWRTRSGCCSVQLKACIPPKLPPITAASWSMPNASSNKACALTQSSTVTTGKSAPYTLPVSGWMCIGPVDPKQDPRLFTPITKKWLVSTGLPGPIMLSHQPSLLSWPAYTPATWWDALSAWQINTAFDLFALSVP